MSKEQSGPAFPVYDAGDQDARCFEGASLREYAAIQLRVPDSGIKWLDDMIRESLRDDFAKAALTGLLANHIRHASWKTDDGDDYARGTASQSYDIASAMLAKKSKK